MQSLSSKNGWDIINSSQSAVRDNSDRTAASSRDMFEYTEIVRQVKASHVVTVVVPE